MTKMKTLATPTSPNKPFAMTGSFPIIEMLAIPAIALRNGKVIATNQAFTDKLPSQLLLTGRPMERFRQAADNVELINDTLSFEITCNSSTYYCTASPFHDSLNTTLIFFEDITSQARAEQNNALLYRLSLLLASTDQPLNDKLQTILDHLLFEFPCYDISIFLLNKEVNYLNQVAWGSTDLDTTHEIAKASFAIGEGVTGYVAKIAKPLVIPNVLTDKRFIRRRPDQPAVTLLGVPLKNNNQLYGVITVTRLIDQSFSDQDVQLFVTIASRLAQVIEADQIAQASQESSEALLNERNKLDQIQNTLHDGLILYTPDMHVSMYNQAAKRILGIKREIIGEDWNTVLNQQINRYCQYALIRHFDPEQFLRNAVDQGKISMGLATVPSQPPKTIEITVAPVYDRHRKISGILSHFRDITQIHDLQQKMSARVQQLTQLFKISSVTGFNAQQIVRRILRLTLPLLTIRSAQLLLIDSNDQTLTILETIGDKELANRLEKEILARSLAVLENREPQALRVTLDKKAAPIHILLVPILGHHHFCNGVLAAIEKDDGTYFSRDDINLLSIVSTQIASKLDTAWLLNQVEEDRNKLATIIDQSVDGILVLDPQEKIQIWNQALERLTGIMEEEVKYRDISEVRTIIEIINRNIADNFTELAIKHKHTGQIVWLGIGYSPITHGGEITGYIAIVRDISRQKELERSKNEFVSTASHELRSPITAIVGYLSMLKRGDAGQIVNKQQAFFVDKAYNNAKRMVSLIEDLLMTTRMETGQVRYQTEPVSLINIIDSILGDVRFRAEEKNITIQLHKENHTSVVADRDGLHQVLSNLITNAIKYTPNGGSVDISFEPAEDSAGRPTLVAHIKDTGVGIETKDLERVFEKFARVDNPLSVSAGGTGLGLYITKGIIEELGGKIWATSQKGKGSTFSISLPIARRNGKERNL